MWNNIDKLYDYIIKSINYLKLIIYNENSKIKDNFIYVTDNFDPLREILRERFLNS